jgi:hypothetical protein
MYMTDPKPRVAVAGLSFSRVRDTIAVHKYTLSQCPSNVPPLLVFTVYPLQWRPQRTPPDYVEDTTRLKIMRSAKQERWDGLGYLDVGDWGVRNTVRRACTDVQETPLIGQAIQGAGILTAIDTVHSSHDGVIMITEQVLADFP